MSRFERDIFFADTIDLFSNQTIEFLEHLVEKMQ